MTIAEASVARAGDRVIVEGKETTILSINYGGVHSPYFRVLNGGGARYSYKLVSLPKEVPTS